MYDAKTGSVVSKFDKHAGTMVYTIAVTKDGKTALSGAHDKTIRIWDVATGKELRTLAGHTEQVYQVSLSPDERHLLSASFDKTLRIWDFATGKGLKRFEGHTDGVQGGGRLAGRPHGVLGELGQDRAPLHVPPGLAAKAD